VASRLIGPSFNGPGGKICKGPVYTGSRRWRRPPGLSAVKDGFKVTQIGVNQQDNLGVRNRILHIGLSEP
jgi:hypothetical protein